MTVFGLLADGTCLVLVETIGWSIDVTKAISVEIDAILEHFTYWTYEIGVLVTAMRTAHSADHLHSAFFAPQPATILTLINLLCILILFDQTDLATITGALHFFTDFELLCFQLYVRVN